MDTPEELFVVITYRVYVPPAEGEVRDPFTEYSRLVNLRIPVTLPAEPVVIRTVELHTAEGRVGMIDLRPPTVDDDEDE